MSKKITIFLFFLCSMGNKNSYGNFPMQAVTIVPVADLTLDRLQHLYPGNKKVSLPLQGKKPSSFSCPRTLQLIFNEQVTILNERDGEVLVEVPHLFYATHNNTAAKNNRYWSKKENFIPLASFDKKKIPVPIRFDRQKQSSQSIISLIKPFYDKKTKQTYSAGTRFVATKKPKHNTTVSVWAPTKHRTVVKIKLPLSICLIASNNKPNKQRKQFLAVLKQWAHIDNGFIPYVWGGCSFTKPYTHQQIGTKTVSVKQKKAGTVFYNKKKPNVECGLDCTGMIARAAQLCSMPYYFKNSFTASKNLEPIETYKELKNGDLIYFNGHMAVVADIDKNTMIEARGYPSGFGKVHEISLARSFNNAKTYKELFTRYKKKEKLERLSKQGEVYENVSNVLLLKLPSAHHNLNL